MLLFGLTFSPPEVPGAAGQGRKPATRLQTWPHSFQPCSGEGKIFPGVQGTGDFSCRAGFVSPEVPSEQTETSRLQRGPGPREREPPLPHLTPTL